MGFSSTVTLSILNFAIVTLADVNPTQWLHMRRETPNQVKAYTLEERMHATQKLQERLSEREESGRRRRRRKDDRRRRRKDDWRRPPPAPVWRPPPPAPTPAPFGCKTEVCKTCVAVSARISDQHCRTCYAGYHLSGAACAVTTCASGLSLHIDEFGVETCVDECPPGMYAYTGGKSPSCTVCNGVSRRRRATECTDCPAGNVAKTESDDCQNVQDTCSKEHCEPCRECLMDLEGDAKRCAQQGSRRRRRPITTQNETYEVESEACFDPGRRWCHRLIQGLGKCLSLSFGCYFKLLCQDPCVCPIWKEEMCGGQVGTGQCTKSLLQAFTDSPDKNNAGDNGRLVAFISSLGKVNASVDNSNMLVRASTEGMQTGQDRLDDTLNDKCQG